MEEKYPWIKDMIENQENLMEVKQITPIYTKINFLLLTKKFDVINYILKSINPEVAHEALLVSIVRMTYKQRKKFPIWKELFDKTNEELVKRNVKMKLEL